MSLHENAATRFARFLVKISFIGATQLFATIGVALGRDDPPPVVGEGRGPPPALPRYEGELRQYQPTEAERRYLPAIDPRKTYNLAELIDIAQRSNPGKHASPGSAPGWQLLPSVPHRERLLPVHRRGCSRRIRSRLRGPFSAVAYEASQPPPTNGEPAERGDCRRRYP